MPTGKHFAKAVKATSGWLGTVWVWLCIQPILIEFGIWFVMACYLLVWSYSEWESKRHVVGFLILTGCTVAAAATAIRHRLNPMARDVFGPVAIVAGTAVIWAVVDKTAAARGFPAPGSWWATLYHIFKFPVFVVGVVAFAEAALIRGLRKRHRFVPRLINVLASGGKIGRRKAILALAQIEELDRVAVCDGGAGWKRQVNRWVFKNDTSLAMVDYIPALQGALRDDDHFVRSHAAKVLTRIGVKFEIDAHDS